MAFNNYGNYPGGQNYYNNQMPVTSVPPIYQQNYQQPNPPVNANQPINGFVWVQGEMEAKMYPVAAGNSVMLMDSENPVMYMKSRDSTGKYLPLETYDLVLRTPQVNQVNHEQMQPQIDLSEYVKISDVDRIISEKVQAAVEKALA